MSVSTKTNGQISTLQDKLVADMRQMIAQKNLTQAQMAAQIGLSGGTMSELLHEKRAFSTALLTKVRKAMGIPSAPIFESTRQYQKMLHLAEFTRQQALFALVCGNTGTGKTATARHIYATSKRTFYIKVEDDLSWRELLYKIGLTLSLDYLPYRTDALREQLQHKVEQLSAHKPLLIIDEAEELSTAVARKLKRLHTLTEGQLGVLIVAHPELRRRLAKASGLHPEGQPRAGRPETQYATLWRRLTHFDLPPVSEEDIGKLCQDELHIKDRAVIALAQEHWTNYGYMARDLLVAEAAGLAWETMTIDEFNFLAQS